MLGMKTSLVTEELDDAIDGLIGKIAHRDADTSDLARYNELTVEAIRQSHFSRRMAIEARRRTTSYMYGAKAKASA